MKEFISKKIKKKTLLELKKLLRNHVYNDNFAGSRSRRVDTFPDLRKNISFCLNLENLLKEDIYLMLPKKYQRNASLQFPMNIRFFNPTNELLKHNYSTDNIHTDVWSGAPLRSKQFILYVYADRNSSYCRMFRSVERKRKYSNFRGKYQNIKINKKDLNEIKYKIEDGRFISFDSMCPHYTYYSKKTKHFRLSIDFRVKFGNPYEINNKRITRKKFVESKIGQPGWGYYWKLSNKKFKNIYNKILYELEFSKSLSKFAFNLRKEYILNKFKFKI